MYIEITANWFISISEYSKESNSGNCQKFKPRFAWNPDLKKNYPNFDLSSLFS